MKTLEKIVSKIDIIDENLKRLIFREVKIPLVDDYNSINNYWYPHPPCLMPLFLGYGSSYKGVVNHFFCNRKNTFVEYNLENSYITEIARTSKQWITLLILNMITINDGVSDEIINFCSQVNFNQLKEVDQYSIDYGDDPNNFDKLINLNIDTPAKYIKEIVNYTGDFPSTLSTLTTLNVQDSSLFEIVEKEDLKDIDNLPIWLDINTNKVENFNQFISNDQLKEAWFTLNSKGWLLKDVAVGLKIMKEKTDNELFHLIAENWINGFENSTFLKVGY